MNGKLIVIEGLDGSGKATQAKMLTEALEQKERKVTKVSFPDYESSSSALVKMYLAGEFGSKPEDVNAYAASAFYAVDRYASFKKDWGKLYAQGSIIVCDRYATSNAIHQCSKLPFDDWDDYLAWLSDFEYGKLGIPEPDKIIYLRGDNKISQKLMEGRYHGDNSKKDIHESNLEYLDISRKAADYCSKKQNWTVVECISNGQMRSREDIHRDVMSVVENLL